MTIHDMKLFAGSTLYTTIHIQLLDMVAMNKTLKICHQMVHDV